MEPHPAPHRTSFIGRRAARSAVAALLHTHRLVTVVGPVGIGKSRLAHAVADDLDRNAAAVVRVDLNDAGDQDALRTALATALGIDAAVLLDSLPMRAPLVLLLDNLGGADDGTLTLLNELLATSPALTLLVTARASLGLAAEALFVVEPLEATEAQALWTARCQSPGDGAPDEDELNRLLAALGGVPLAVERCAALAPVLSPRQAWQRLHRDLELLDRAPVDGPARHRSFSAALDAAVAQRPAHVQELWRACSVFAGPFSVDDAERVVAPGGGVDVVRGLLDLVDASLLRAVHADRGPALLTFLTPLRTHAAARLRAHDAERGALHARHAAWAVDVDDTDLDRLAARAADLHRVLDDAAGGDAISHVGRAALLLVKLARHRGPLGSIDAVVTRAAAHPLDDDTRAALLLARARAAVTRGDLDAADADLGRVAAVATAEAHAVRSLVARRRGDVDRARACLEAAATAARAAGDRIAAADLVGQHAALVFEHGDADAALALFDAALREQRVASAPPWAQGVTLTNLALVLQERGRFDEAAHLLDEALALARGASHRRFEAIARGDQGTLLLERGQPLVALPQLQDAVALADAVGDHRHAHLLRSIAALCGAWSGQASSQRGPAAADVVDDDHARAARVYDAARAAVLAFSEPAERRLPRAVVLGRLDDQLRRADAFAARSDEVRLALRVSRTLHARIRSTLVVVDEGGVGFRVDDEAPVSLAEKPLWARLLWTLSRASLCDVAVDSAALLQSGWPGEKMLPASAQNRLAVALSGLRKLGLTSLSRHEADGYRLRGCVLVRPRA